jgi:hypothetical protein
MLQGKTKLSQYFGYLGPKYPFKKYACLSTIAESYIYMSSNSPQIVLYL